MVQQLRIEGTALAALDHIHGIRGLESVLVAPLADQSVVDVSQGDDLCPDGRFVSLQAVG